MAHETWLDEIEDRARAGRSICSDRHEVEVLGDGLVRLRCGAGDRIEVTRGGGALDRDLLLVDEHRHQSAAEVIVTLVERVRTAEAALRDRDECLLRAREQLLRYQDRYGWGP